MNENDDMNRLATELLHEVKAQAKRWFTAFTLVCFLELITILSFMWYLSLPVEDVRVDSNGAGTATYVGNDLNGGVYNGESESSTESSQE